MAFNFPNNKKKILKYFVIFFTFLIFIIFFVNFTFGFLQNRIVSIINSGKFENYLLYRLDHYLEKAGQGELSQQEIDKYSIIVDKIYKKYKPVIENLKKNN
tara:strand:- start:331 stop:633 length:303 start_codon:yes stop_codon:yes gene_type:complete